MHNGALHQHHLRKGERRVQRLCQRRTVGGDADADARTEVCRLDDYRIAERRLNVRHGADRVGVVGGRVAAAVQHRDAVILEDRLHRVFVQHLDVARQRAVLGVCAVHNRKRHIKLPDAVFAERLRREAVDARHIALADERHALAFSKQGGDVLVVFNREERLARVKAVVLGDVERNHIVFVAVDCQHRLHGGNDGNLVFGGLAAEEYAKLNLHSLSFHMVKNPHQKLSGRSFSSSTTFFLPPASSAET